MNGDCLRYCPIARECASIAAGLESDRESILDQSSDVLAATDYEQQAELYGALSILSGEVTAEQSDEFNAKINEQFEQAFGVSKKEWFERAATDLPQELVKVRQAEAAISVAAGAIALIQADCKGPKVGIKARLRELKDRFSDYWHNRRFSGGTRGMLNELAETRQTNRHATNLAMHSRCTNKQARLALKQAIKNPMVKAFHQDLSEYFE